MLLLASHSLSLVPQNDIKWCFPFFLLFCFGLLQVLLLALHSMITLGSSQGTIRVVKDWTSIGCVQDKYPTCCTFFPACIFLKKFLLCFKLAKCFRTGERPMLNGSSYPEALTTCWLSGRLLPQSFLPGINTCSLHHHVLRKNRSLSGAAWETGSERVCLKGGVPASLLMALGTVPGPRREWE